MHGAKLASLSILVIHDDDQDGHWHAVIFWIQIVSIGLIWDQIFANIDIYTLISFAFQRFIRL